jgi:hypothetical protein
LQQSLVPDFAAKKRRQRYAYLGGGHGASTKLSENIVVRVKLWAVLLRLPPCAQPGSCRVVPRADNLWIAADDCLDDEETDNGGAAGAAGVAGAGAAAAGAAAATGAAAGAAGAGFGLGAMT